jgi:hypothetical protein
MTERGNKQAGARTRGSHHDLGVLTNYTTLPNISSRISRSTKKY